MKQYKITLLSAPAVFIKCNNIPEHTGGGVLIADGVQIEFWQTVISITLF